MAKVLDLLLVDGSFLHRSPVSTKLSTSASRGISQIAIAVCPSSKWATIREELKCQGRHSCFFTDGRKQEQARKALESALDGKKSEFEKWNKEIQKREEMGGGGTAGRGGWFGGGGWFGWFSGEHFWEEAQQASLSIIGILSLYLLLVKGNVIFAVISNSLLFLLRGLRNWLTILSSRLPRRPKFPVPGSQELAKGTNLPQLSAKERVVRKWGMD
ncbi:hypothetical protein AXF42_Ash004667 [Apostasia shenzhenica]|uniref:Uncharacterized protein n=1 Tax=Apostasia shenzhenica TaxID=1088818 RepID=A0A2I0BHB0_9ASPA|nr:hypothetical protein AXF42_Ash004667 [Apostasia shenzhenica]